MKPVPLPPLTTDGCSKYLDSHLRPYTCRFANTKQDCEDLRFSSNACLFRHEREAHGLHNHGHNPFLCKFVNCERAKPTNGFPRKWNLRDHMKRMHNYVEDDEKDDRRRRQAPGSVPMRRSGSAGRPRGPQPYTRDARPSVARRQTQAVHPHVPDFTMPVTNALDPFQFNPSLPAMYYQEY